MFEESEYEFFTDMRKFYKKSVSLLLTISLELYLDEYLTNSHNVKVDGRHDNYPFSGRTMARIVLPEEIIWRIHWEKT